MTRILAVVVVLVLATLSSFSQGTDFGIWYCANAEISLAKKLDLDLSSNIRTFRNASKIDEAFGEIGFSYKIVKGFSVAGAYRLTSQYEDKVDAYYIRHRFMGDIKGTVGAGRFDFSGRLRFQRETKTYFRDANDEIPNYFSRIKLKTTYNTKGFPVNPYIAYEAFARIFEGSSNGFEKFRYSVGGDYKINKNHSLELEYMYQRDLFPKPENINIISIGYNLKF